jgi:hypothetical protein
VRAKINLEKERAAREAALRSE